MAVKKRKNTSVVVKEFDPLKGQRFVVEENGRPQDLPWNALAEVTYSTGSAMGPVVLKALKHIRIDAWEAAQSNGVTLEQVQADPRRYEEALAREITKRALALKQNAPHLDWGPFGVARHWMRTAEAPGDRAARVAEEHLRTRGDNRDRQPGEDRGGAREDREGVPGQVVRLDDDRVSR